MPKLSRRHPAAIALLLLLGLLVSGTAYSAFAPKDAQASVAAADSVENGNSADSAETGNSADSVETGNNIEKGKKLFTANCATCHGANGLGIEGTGPSLAGVGAASVDFQMGTGRMPMAAPDVQAPGNIRVKFSDEEISDVATYVASLGAGPAIPPDEYTDVSKGDPGKGGELYRVNCATCHSSAAVGGALTRGKSAPAIEDVSGKYIYEAMITGPQSMPVFNDANLDPEDKRDVIAYLKTSEAAGNPGGNPLGGYGPVPEGLFAWTIGLGLLVAAAVWLGKKSA